MGFGFNYVGDGLRDRRPKCTAVDKFEPRLQKIDSRTCAADAHGARSPSPKP